MAQQDTDQIFREVDEELRKEKLEQLWKQYGSLIAAAAIAVVVGVGGWKAYDHFQSKRIADAGARFNSAILAIESKKTEDAEKALKELGSDGPASYRALARMRLAALEQSSGRTDEAVKAYDAIAADGKVDALMRGLAGIKAAMLRTDTADFTEMQNRLTPLKDAKSPWSLSARELLGLAAWKAGKLAEAEAEYQSLIGDRSLPQGMRQRVEMMLSLILEASKPAAQPASSPAAGSAPAAPASATEPATAPPQAATKEQEPAAPKGGAVKGGAKGAQK